MKPELAIVVALDDKRGIGKDGDIPWGRIPEDLKHFAAVTTNHPVIMGRVTYMSIPEKYRPLKDRQNIVLTHQDITIPGVIVAHSMEEAIHKARELDNERICFIGGERIYREALSIVDTLYLTHIEGDFNCDTFFPDYLNEFPVQRKLAHSEANGLHYSFEELGRS